MTVRLAVDLVEHECWSCGIVYAVPENYDRHHREKGGVWVCPNGHGSTYKNPEMARLRASLQTAQQEAINARDETKKALAKAKRIEKRALAGVCPKCGRTFIQVKRHIATKHPENVT